MLTVGYFSNLATEFDPCDRDHSYIPPDKQLLWRLEDLEERLCELNSPENKIHDESVHFSEDELRYVLPEHFLSVNDVRKAIEFTIDDLTEQYGIHIREKPVEEVLEMDEITGLQISFLDILSIQALNQQSIAA